jgi:glycine/D-amino acid oxidase-like deaminating enzyme
MVNLVMGWSSDFVPYVGDVPGKLGQIVIAGFSGHGMPQILLATKGVTGMLKGKPFEEAGLPKLFKLTVERLTSEKNDILDGHPAPMPAARL